MTETNPDRHDRRRQEKDPDGRAVAAALYGGDICELEDEGNDPSDEPTLFDDD